GEGEPVNREQLLAHAQRGSPAEHARDPGALAREQDLDRQQTAAAEGRGAISLPELHARVSAADLRDQLADAAEEPQHVLRPFLRLLKGDTEGGLDLLDAGVAVQAGVQARERLRQAE